MKPSKDYITKCQLIYKHFGSNAQNVQLIQECSELIKAITKGDKKNFIEELADVKLLIDQILLSYPDIAYEVNICRTKKLNRTLKRISEGYYARK